MPASIWKWKMLAGLIFLTGFTNQPAFFKAKCWLNLKSCWKLKWFEELRLTGALLRSWERQGLFWGAENDRGCFKELRPTGALLRSWKWQVRFWGAERHRGCFEELRLTGALLRSWKCWALPWQLNLFWWPGSSSLAVCQSLEWLDPWCKPPSTHRPNDHNANVAVSARKLFNDMFSHPDCQLTHGTSSL